MKRILFYFIAALVIVTIMSLSPSKNTSLTEDYPIYEGNDLGVMYSPEKTSFKIWAPTATAATLRLYEKGIGGEPLKVLEMKISDNGTWAITLEQELKNKYYSFQIYNDGKWLLEKPDIYAKAVGVNGERGMIVDLNTTNPDGWLQDKKPKLKTFSDIIIYEMHMRDISMNQYSGITHKGKFIGLSETGTKNVHGQFTGLSHIKELGVTHIHLLPCFDFYTVDETKPESNQYNWGYDPLNYNVPEGSYSTDPYDGNTRIYEFKKMVKTLHDNGLRVIMDVAYNHTSDAGTAVFNQFVPGYFYRQDATGNYSNASGCGNETASEQAMMRKFMIESLVYWATEYHIDGFRFDLMGIHDITTMNAISDTLHKIDPTIYIYGEGWTAGGSPLPDSVRAIKKNVSQLHQIAAFADELRDGLRGKFDNEKSKAFAAGNTSFAESVKFGIVAATKHPQINYAKVNYSKAPWATEPYQSINYASCHDDHCLYDRLKVSNPESTEDELIKMDKLCIATVLTSQGIPFIYAGEEILRTKKGVGNSYKSPDSINEIDWNKKLQYHDVFNYYKNLIALRKNHPAFRMVSTAMIQDHLRFIETDDEGIIAYQISGNANNDTWENILVILNGNKNNKSLLLPSGKWVIAVDGNTIDEKGIKKIKSGNIELESSTAYVLYSE